MIYFYDKNKVRMCAFTTPIQHYIESKKIKLKKKIFIDWKEKKIKISLFVYDMLVYIENTNTIRTKN